MPISEELKRRDKIVAIIETALNNHGVSLKLGRMNYHLGEKLITEFSDEPDRLSQTVLDVMFPPEPAPSTLYHYTDLQCLQGIASSGELRLYPIRKRLGQGGELEAFARAHGLQGYLDISKGNPIYKELSDDLFYTSMTRDPPKDPSLMWGAFSKGTGARLEFSVKPKAAELRPVHYEQNSSTTLLRDINQALKAADEPPFNPKSISKIGAFYLNWTVALEDEVRLLVKRHPDGINLTRNDGQFDYWPIPIGKTNAVCDLQLTGIHVAPGASRQAIGAAPTGTPFAAVSVSGP